MKHLDVWAWGKKIGTIAQTGNRIAFELEDESYKYFSPLTFEHRSSIYTSVESDGSIDKIGLIADALPGKYGKEYLDSYFIDEFGKKPSIIDRLAFVGSHGLGALEFQPSSGASDINADLILSLEELRMKSRKVHDGEHDIELSKLIAVSNSAAGGAKAKAVVGFNPENSKIHIGQKHEEEPEGFKKCIIKFNSKDGVAADEQIQEIRSEYVYYLMAKKAGIIMSDSWLAGEGLEQCFVTERFDIQDGDRMHMHSLAGIFNHDASSFTMGYESLLRAANMLAIPQEGKVQAFKTMLFNLVFSNRDDHSRNFSFLMDRHNNWQYAPAYDLTFSVHNHGTNWHQMTLNKRPMHQAREISIKKVAKIINVDNPLDILKDMIAIKHDYLEKLFREYNIDSSISNQIMKSTKEIDDRFGD